MNHASTPANPSLPRRLAALVYDSLLMIAVWMAATALWLAAQGGEAPEPEQLPFQLYLLLVAFAFLGGFWVNAGRTLGMQAWRLRVVDAEGHLIGWLTAAVRFAAACLSWALLGGGFLWAVLDRDGLTLHDRLAGTRVIVLPRA